VKFQDGKQGARNSRYTYRLPPYHLVFPFWAMSGTSAAASFVTICTESILALHQSSFFCDGHHYYYCSQMSPSPLTVSLLSLPFCESLATDTLRLTAAISPQDGWDKTGLGDSRIQPIHFTNLVL
jgi:hypothetical protein